MNKLRKNIFILKKKAERLLGLDKHVVLSSHKLKSDTIKKYGHDYRCKTFVETGTYKGDMIEAVKNQFEYIYSIEVGEQLWRDALNRFLGENKIEILFGDSKDVLPKLMPKLKNSCLFFLDGHYSGGDTSQGEYDTPVSEEIKVILGNSKEHVIIIDDARLFDGINYPTIKNLKNLVRKFGAELKVEIADDLIRIHK